MNLVKYIYINKIFSYIIMSGWTEHVSRIFKENKNKAGYKFKDALKDASKTWNKSLSSSSSPTKTRRGRKTRRSGKSRRRRSL
jgi:hypothetical protein